MPFYARTHTNKRGLNMLKKELCIKCWKKGHKINGVSYEWTKEDEIRWKVGWVYCPVIKTMEYHRAIIKEPPNDCFFLIEQILSKED